MSFTIPCFIRKNTPEIRAKLEDIGYIKMLVWTRETDICLKTSPMLEVVGTNDYAPQYYTFSSLQSKPDSLIDCGTNEPLFLAIAALRDDDILDRWYWYKNRLFRCVSTGSTVCMDGHYSLKLKTELGWLETMDTDVVEATIPELIEHFKSEE